MREIEDSEERPEEQGRRRAARRHYEPLFSDWDNHPHDEEPHGDDFDFLSYPPSSPGHPADGHDAFRWEPAQRASQESSGGYASGAGSPWYPAPRAEPAYQPQLTDVQRALREGVVTVPRRERRWVVTVRELAETLLLALLIFLSVRASFQNFRVEGASMNPSLEDGEYLIVNKLSYARIDLGMFDFLPFVSSGEHHLWGSPGRGDVIVFQAPTNPTKDFIKRIIGTPGDTVEIKQSGEVLVNGNKLQEPYITGTTNCNSNQCIWEIPEQGSADARAKCDADTCYFVMGDNRQNSSDSRQGWLVPEGNIIGKALITYWHAGGPELDLAPNHSVAADAR